MVIKIDQNHKYCGLSVQKLLSGLTLSTKMIKRLKYRPDGILVNGSHVTVRYILKDGDVLSLALDDNESSKNAPPSDIPIDIIYENNDFIALNKPPFMPTHPSHNHHSDTLANACSSYFGKFGQPFVFRPINRLDRNTSGIVVVAKNQIAASQLALAMKERKFTKSYVAYLDGFLPDPTETVIFMGEEFGVIDKPIRRAQKSIIFREVCSINDEGAEEAITYYRILHRSADCTEVEIYPQTGRTHQLRVHFASIGHSIIGDDLYGTESQHIGRHALHARSLVFPLPKALSLNGTTENDEMICLEAPIPADMTELYKIFFDQGEKNEKE